MRKPKSTPAPAPVVDAPAVDAPAPVVVTEPAVVVVDDAPAPAPVPAVPGFRSFTFTDGTDTVVTVTPPHVNVIADAFRAVTATDASTADTDRATRARLATTFRARLATVPGFNAEPAFGRSVFGSGIGDAQSDVAVAAALAAPGALPASGVIVAMWDAMIPRRACAFLDRPSYGRSTTREILNGTHPGRATFANAVRLARAVRFHGYRPDAV